LLVNADVPVMPSGVLVFEHDAGSRPIGADAVEIFDDSGDPVMGEFEPELVPRSWPGLWFWRPAKPFTPNARYSGIARNGSTGETRELVFVTAATDAAAQIDPDQFRLALTTHLVDGAITQCCQRDDEVPPNCFSPVLVNAPKLTVTLDPADPDPMLRQLLFTVSSGDPDGSVDHFAFVDRRGTAPAVLYRERRAEYCAEVSVLNLVTLEQRELPKPCIADRPELFETTVVKESPELAGALIALGCQRPPQGFEPAWCEVNMGHCYRRASLQCEYFEAICPDYPRELAAEAGVPPDAGDRTIPASSSGCGVARFATLSAPWWLELALLGSVLRRRRASPSTRRGSPTA
jgi:hypothetical protein